MNNECLSSDIINTLPENIIEDILTLMPIQDALRTSILSKKWRYTWQNMPKLVFTEEMVKLGTRCIKCSDCDCRQLRKYKLISAIFHVLLLHNGSKKLELDFSGVELDIDSEFPQIISYIARGNKVKELTFAYHNGLSAHRLPDSFFSLQGLEVIYLENCTFEPPPTFKGFIRLKSVTLSFVNVSAQMLQRFISKCPLLDQICLGFTEKDYEFVEGRNKFTFVDLFQCVPYIRSLLILKFYMKYLCAGDMPHKLPTLHLNDLTLEVCLAEQTEISSALSIIRSSPLLVTLNFLMYDKEMPLLQTPNNFFDLKHYSDLKLDYLDTMKIEEFTNLPLEMEFVKLIMAKSPVLREVRIKLSSRVSYEEEKMLRDLVLQPFPRASLSAKLTIYC